MSWQAVDKRAFWAAAGVTAYVGAIFALAVMGRVEALVGLLPILLVIVCRGVYDIMRKE